MNRNASQVGDDLPLEARIGVLAAVKRPTEFLRGLGLDINWHAIDHALDAGEPAAWEDVPRAVKICDAKLCNDRGQTINAFLNAGKGVATALPPRLAIALR